MFIDTMAPLNMTDNPSFRTFIEEISDFQLPTRKTLEGNLTKIWYQTKCDLINILYKQKYLATTADSWSVQNRIFLGMTVNWIDSNNLMRKKATLACKEIKVFFNLITLQCFIQ